MAGITTISLHYFFSVVGACKNCTNQDFTKVQLLCGESNQELVNAQNQFSEQNQHLLCKYVVFVYFLKKEKKDKTVKGIDEQHYQP